MSRKKMALLFCFGIITLAVWRYPVAAEAAIVGGFALLTHLLGF